MKINLFQISALIICTYLILTIGIIKMIPDSEMRGQFGDLFGSINGLFSALAFGAIIYSIWLQREDLKNQKETIEMQIEELKHQREELELTREEMKLSRRQHEIMAEANQEQVAQLKKQNVVSEHINKLKVYQSRIEAIQNILQGSSSGKYPIDRTTRNFYEQSLKETFSKYEVIARKDIDKLGE